MYAIRSYYEHGHTYMGHPTAAAAGVAVVSAILDRGLLPRVREQGKKLAARLEDRFGQHPHVGDLRGRGLFRGIELPLASRSMLAGIKTSAIINIGTATLGALIGAGGYGQPILTGIRLDDTALILEGAIPAALMALAAQSYNFV